MLECTKDETSGCLTWTSVETCDPASHCEESTHTCEAGCKDVCQENEIRCDDAEIPGIQACTKNEQTGCFEWGPSQSCGANQWCYGEPAECQYACGKADSEGCKPFSIVILPDTQGYIGHHTINFFYNKKYKNDRDNPEVFNNIYNKQTKWIVDNQENRNIKFVMHMGDVINDNFGEGCDDLFNDLDDDYRDKVLGGGCKLSFEQC